GRPSLDAGIVREDPVVDNDETTRAVGVGMGVLFRGSAVGRPARVADADGPGQRTATEHGLEHLEPARRAPHLELTVPPEDRHARRIVTAVLEALESLDDDADRVLVAHVPPQPTHRAQSFPGTRSFGLAARSRALRSAQPGFSTCWARPSTSAPAGTSRVIVEPAAT